MFKVLNLFIFTVFFFNAAPAFSQQPKTTRYEVILITEGTTAQSTYEELPEIPKFYPRYAIEKFNESSDYKPQSTTTLNFDEVTAYAQKAYEKSLEQNKFKFYQMEALIQIVPQLTGSESQIAEQIAGYIERASNSEQDKYNYLTILMDRLYRNYNDNRNPGANTFQQADVITTNVSLKQMFAAAALQNKYQGGVCNDISQSIATIGEKLFPNYDVLTITSGTHFGVIVANGNETHVINWGEQMVQRGQSALFLDHSPINARIGQVVNGKLKEIAVMDTQNGQLINTAFGLDKPNLRTGISINDVFVRVKKITEQKNKPTKELSITAGAGHLIHSNVTVVVAKYEHLGTRNHGFVGVGTDYNSYYHGQGFQQLNAQVKAGYDRVIFRYVNPKVAINFNSGIQADGQLGMDYNGVNVRSTTYSIELVNRLNFAANAGEDGIRIYGNAQLRSGVGTYDSGGMTGELSTLSPYHVAKAFEKFNLFLNQVVVNGTVIKPMNQNLSIRGDAFYQGSNVGQSASIMGGVNLHAFEGAQFYIFTGVETSEWRGYRTQHSILAGPQGGKLGVRYQGRRGMSVQVQLQGIGSKQPIVNGTLKLPIRVQKKKSINPVLVSP